MRIIRHSADKFRNLSGLSFEPDEEMNIIYGENGQGKTNIIESMWLFTGCYSFRTRKNAQLIMDNEKEATASVDFYADGREQNAVMKINQRKEVTLNGIKSESPRVMLGRFYAVVFSPNLLSIVQDGPGERRKLMDVAISLIKPNYAVLTARYLRAVEQRNALLRQMVESPRPAELEPWDEEIVKLGSRIVDYRLDYIDRLRTIAGEIYGGISAGREEFLMDYDFYRSGEKPSLEAIAEKLRSELEKNRESDIRRQYTSAGPHAHDLILTLNGRDARVFGSQGQQRSASLAMKLGEAAIIKELCGEEPVVLLDDVMSELDEGRQGFILNYLTDWQVFITCCDPSQLLRSKKGKAFEVKSGKIEEIS